MIIDRKNDAITIRNHFTSRKDHMTLLLISDVHIDAKDCDRKLLIGHLEEAKARGAGVLIFGDLFDCMGGKYDKRTTKSDLLPEYQVNNYFDAIVKDAAKILKPYAENILMIGDGNHELSVRERHETDLIQNLIDQLRPEILHGKYSGFIRVFFERCEKRRGSFTIYYNHGSGGNSPASRGVLQSGRRQESREADIYVSGHNHNSWDMPRPKLVLNAECVLELTEPEHLNLGTYKNDLLSGGFADIKEFPPPALGGYWLKFFQKNDRTYFETVRAKV